MSLSVETRARTRVPRDEFSGDVPLVAVERGGMVGSLHRGTLVASTPDGEVLFSLGDPHQTAFLRSSAKPFQAMPALLTGGFDRFGITERELAVLCASHSGEPCHVEAVSSVLEKIGLGEEHLLCGVHPPLHEESAIRRWRDGLEPTAACNNCSGAHVSMLVACVAAGWPVDTYDRPEHPLQRMTLDVLGAFADVAPERIPYAVDNCTVPTFRLPMDRSAQAFGRLATGDGVSSALAGAARRVVSAMTTFPEMVAGEDRFDTDLMRGADGLIVCKGGAEGFVGIGLLERRAGVAIKISDGNARAIPPSAMVAIDALQPLGEAATSALAAYREEALHDRRGHRVGRVAAVFDLGGTP